MSTKKLSEHLQELFDHPSLDAWFLGPKAEHGRFLEETVGIVLADYIHWRRNYSPDDPVVIGRDRWHEHEDWQHDLSAQLDLLLAKLKAGVPFYSPRYLAQMTSDQTLPSVIGFLAGLLYNPNNVTNEAGPVTVDLELEVGDLASTMLGYNPGISPGQSWAHLCSGGSSANLEALWVARAVQFNALAIWHACCNDELPSGFEIKGKDGNPRAITSLKRKTDVLGLAPREAISMPRRLVDWLTETARSQLKEWSDESKFDPANQDHIKIAAINWVNDVLDHSRYNVAKRGFHAAAKGLSPVIFAPASAHYSVMKAANILGYGEGAVCLIDIDDKFRMNVTNLEDKLEALEQTESENSANRLSSEDQQYVAAVVTVIGTTEEGAVDPLHKVLKMRQEREEKGCLSFWVHADAAWGGYFASLFRGWGLRGRDVDLYIDQMNVFEPYENPFTDQTDELGTHWKDRDVYQAFLSLPRADSITVDPHKLGYVPYPAGLIAFRDNRVTEHVRQTAEYIGIKGGGISGVDYVRPDAIGQYIIEGSKPGAAAASAWLAHKAIPLDKTGHGKIIRSTALTAQRLYEYLNLDGWYSGELKRRCEDPQRRRTTNPEATCPIATRFKVISLTQPDTNVVCFLAAPEPAGSMSVQKVNEWNERIFERLRPPTPEDHRPINEQEYFISHTKFNTKLYTAKSILGVLERAFGKADLETTKGQYEADGLYVLRSTLMNPLHDFALAGDVRSGHEGERTIDYLKEFVKHLYSVAWDTHPDIFVSAPARPKDAVVNESLRSEPPRG